MPHNQSDSIPHFQCVNTESGVFRFFMKSKAVKYRTFREWGRAGCLIIKGSKATWHDGAAYFSEAQVRLKPKSEPALRSAWPLIDTANDPNPMPSDAGSPVSDRHGRECGTRGYTQFNSPEWVPVTYHSDGSSTVHCGGPCSPLYVDEFGNT